MCLHLFAANPKEKLRRCGIEPYVCIRTCVRGMHAMGMVQSKAIKQCYED